MKRKRRRNNKKKRLRLLLLLLPLALIFIVLFNKTNAITFETSKPTKTEYMDKIDTKGFLILNEKTYTAQGDGVVDYSVRDGERVPKDFVVANLNLMVDVTDLKDELLKVQSAIEHKNQNLNPSNTNYEISDTEINLIGTIQDALIKDEMNGVLEAIETLELNTKKNVDISEISSLINLSNQELEDRRDELSREISTSNVVYKSEVAGIVSYKIDNLEDVLTEESIPEIDYNFLLENTPKEITGQQNQVKMGDPLYKLIDNFLYYISIPIDNVEEISNYSKGDSVELLINSKITLRGTVEEINKTDNTGVMTVRLKEKLSEVGFDRQLDVSVVKDKDSAFVIPTKSIVEINNQLGVYVLELNGIVRFRPIDIITQRDLDTIISVGDSNGYIKDINNEDVRTLTVFDEVIIEPGNIEEGQIIR